MSFLEKYTIISGTLADGSSKDLSKPGYWSLKTALNAARRSKMIGPIKVEHCGEWSVDNESFHVVYSNGKFGRLRPMKK